MAPAVPAVIILAVFLFSFAVVYTLRAFINAMFQTLIDDLKAIPIIGGKLASPLEGIAQAVSHALGAAEGRIDQAFGASMHAMARLTDWTWRELKAHSILIAAIASIVAHLTNSHHALKSRVQSIAHGTAAVLPRVKSLEKEYHGIEHRVKKIEREIGKGIGHDLRIQVKALEGEVAKVEDKVIPNLRSLAHDAEAEAQRALGKVEAIPFPSAAKTWAEAIALALPALGLEWLRCNSNPFKGNKKACSLWGDLAGLLGLAAAADLALHIDEIVKIIEELTPPAVAVMNKAK